MKIKHYLTIATLFFLAAMNLSAKSEHKTVNDIPYRDSAGESAYALERCLLDVIILSVAKAALRSYGFMAED